MCSLRGCYTDKNIIIIDIMTRIQAIIQNNYGLNHHEMPSTIKNKPSAVGITVFSSVATCFSFCVSKSFTADTSGSVSGLSSSLMSACVGNGFFSAVSTCFSFPWSKLFTSARESAASSLITRVTKIENNSHHVSMPNLP